MPKKSNCVTESLRSVYCCRLIYVNAPGVCVCVCVCVCLGSAVSLNMDDKWSRRTVYDGVVHDPLHVSVDTISVGGTVTPLLIGSHAAQSTFSGLFT